MNGYSAPAERAGGLKVGEVSWRTQLSFYVNGKAVKVQDAEPHHTLLWFLRERLGLTGTKLGCGEGGCGACTVTVAQFVSSDDAVVHRAVNACLAPLCSVDGCHVTTVEGIGTSNKPHPVQRRVAELHGSQCGFCTPGIVMSLYTTLCRTSKPTLSEIESSFDGNLCRCTGYRPILDAAKSFVCDKEKCPSSGAEPAQSPEQEKDAKICSTTADVLKNLADEKIQEASFPEALKTRLEPLKVTGTKVTWYRPTDLATLLMLKKAEPKAKMVAGNTEVGIETKFKQCEYGTMISTSAVAELQELSIRNGVMTIGGAVTLSTLEHFLEAQESNVRYQAMLDMLRWFASAQIRNVAVLAGNIATASPISDMNPVLMALDASLILASAGQAPREVPMKEFFKSYRVVDMQPAEVICAIKVPGAGDFEFVRSFKQARRRDDDISIVNACLCAKLQPNSDGWVVETASAAFGGMAPTTLRARKLEAALTGAPWNKETLEKAQEVLAEELSLPETVPGGMAAYRQTLAASFLYKFYVATCLELSKRAGASLPKAPAIAPDEASAARSFLSEDRPLTHGSQAYVVPSGGLQSTSVMGSKDHAPLEEESRAPVGQPLMHRSALPQCTGEAKYTDDMPKLPGTLHGVLVLSERPHAKILSIDTSAALAYPKVVEVFTGKDLSEKQNAWGPAYVDEQLFRTDEVTSTGQALGIVVAETLEAAEKAARLVKVQYSDLEPIITVEDAIKAQSFKDKVLKIEDGDIESAFNQSDSVIVEGEVRMGGQEHFYLECNAALAVPGEADELTVHVSSQTANKTQKFAANVCGIPCSKVVCKVKRMGGGFGGKETRTVIFSSAAALAAHRLKQPVKINVDRDVDMWVTGGRHPFLARYRAAAGPDGKLRALDAKLYCNAGYSMDLTEPVMGRALFHSDGCYKIPNVRVEGFMCMTNTTSNTAFRGFGGPQGLMVAEAYMTHLASALKMSPEELRIRNTYAFDGELEQEFPAKLRRAVAEKKVELYTIDAHAVASSVGLPAKRINQVMQATFFNLSGILPPEDAKEQLEGAIDRMYGKKSPEIVKSNKAALAAAPENLNRINYPSSWLTAEDNEHSLRRMNPSASPYSPQLDEFSSTFLKSIDSRTADELAVSAFSPGGETPIGQSTHQKRALAEEVPVWLPDKCTQCNLCSVVCPHAVVRPFLLDKKEMEAAPEGFVARKAKGGDLGGLNYTIQLAPFDCTGCAVCVEMCPDDALIMEPASHSQEKFNDHWEYSLNKVAVKDNLMERGTVKGSQFQEPLIEFSGACSGCGETPYVKLLTQMFGDRMVIANSSGCSSVWGGSYGLSPFKKNRHGQGPAWARSLFEDTAEYGLGMALGSQQRRERLVADVRELLEEVQSGAVISAELQSLLERWIEVVEDAEKCTVLQGPLKAALANEAESSESPAALSAVKRAEDLLVAPSHWIIGGDGWAYDIGFGGLDHVLATGQNVNVLVLDTEGYSNTGAQNSKATPKGATMKMSAGGNKAKKKDLGAIAMMHENAYVASVSLSADVNQTVKAFKEAEAYPGPSIIIAYATCVDWGHRAGDKAMVQQQVQAVESGYWPLYRYNPEKVTGENNGFELDNKRITPDAMDSLMRNENRFTSLQRSAPEYAQMLQNAMKDEFFARHETRKRRAMGDEDLLEYLKKSMGEQVTGERVTVLYGTDTGNAEMVAKNFQFEFKRRGMKAKCLSLNDMPISDLAEESKVLAIVATAGQGEMPKSAVKFWQDMETFLETAPADYLKDTKFAVFGLGDSSYVFFNEAAKRIDEAFAKLGGERVQSLGLGDNQHPGRFDTELEEWSPDFYDNIEAPEPPQELSPPSHLVELLPEDDPKAKRMEAYVPAGSKPVQMTIKRSTVPEGYERAIDHFEFDLTGSGLSYEQGDSLGLWPSNPKKQVDMCLMALNMKGDEILYLRPIDSNRSVPLPEVIDVRSLLTQVLDIAGWPKRRFYEMLKLSATDAGEKEQLQKLCSKEGKAEYQAYADESYTYAELLQKFPSCKVNIGHLLDYVPDIKPRLYSIASSSRLRGDNVCHLCIIKNEWNATSGRSLTGLSTRWLSEDLHPAEVGSIGVRACVHPSAVTLPEKHSTPMLMVALGTGIAPMRAFIEERAAAKKDGEDCGPMALFFGARNRQEYSYEAEFDQYHKDGVLTHIHLALSREQKEKIYVTHRLQQNKKLVYDLIHEKEGNLYLCGPGGNVPPQVRQAVIDAIKDGGHSAEYAEKYVQEMQINGRYNVEAW